MSGAAVRPLAVEAIDAVVIGASAGGIEALCALLPSLPRGLRASVFITLHLPRNRPSVLVEIFSPRCALPVFEAQDKQPVVPGTVGFAPPDYHLLIDRGPAFALSADLPVHHSRPAIDVLFESAADQYGERLLGIVLSGANQDGAAGLAAVHAAGGACVVQQPASASAAAMPEAALKQVPSAAVLTLAEIGALLAQLPSTLVTATRRMDCSE